MAAACSVARESTVHATATALSTDSPTATRCARRRATTPGSARSRHGAQSIVRQSRRHARRPGHHRVRRRCATGRATRRELVEPSSTGKRPLPAVQGAGVEVATVREDDVGGRGAGRRGCHRCDGECAHQRREAESDAHAASRPAGTRSANGANRTASKSLLDSVEGLAYVCDAVASLFRARMIERSGAGRRMQNHRVRRP